MGGGKQPAAPTTAGTAAAEENPLTAEQLSALLSLLSSAVSLSLRFHHDRHPLLLPSQSLALSSALRSAALPLSRLLHPSPFPAAAAADDDGLRIPAPTFRLLLRALSPALAGPPDSHEPALAAALFRLAHAAPLRAAARRFGLPSPRAACAAFYDVVRAVIVRLGHLLEFSADATRVLDGFRRISLPNCCGALGFAKFPINSDDTNKRWIVVQAVVDAEGRFRDISAGWDGSMSPAEILPATKLYKDHSFLLNSGLPCEQGRNPVPCYLLGGSCCPLLPWLLTPFRTAEPSSEAVREYNAAHRRGMEMVGRAFGSVRARWRLLGMGLKEDCAEALPYVVIAGCLLHNFLIKCGEPMPVGISAGEDDRFEEFVGKVDEAGERVREVLASHLNMVSQSNKMPWE